MSTPLCHKIADFWFSPGAQSYIDFTPSTAIYPQIRVESADGMVPGRATKTVSRSGGYLYLVGGVIEELEELREAETHEQVIAEAGDVLWYLAQLITFFGVAKPDMREARDLGMIGKCSVRRWAGFAKKLTRDDYGEPTIMRYEQVTRLIVETTAHLQDLLAVEDATLTDAMVGNRVKLESRAKRGVLGGSGDKR